MKLTILAFTLLATTVFADTKVADSKPVPSGPLKAFSGGEGRVITMVEVNDGKEMLVHFKGLGGEVEGKTRLYTINNEGRGKMSLTWQKKRGSKWLTLYIAEYRDDHWKIFNPVKSGFDFNLSYSEKESEKMKVEDVLEAYKPESK